MSALVSKKKPLKVLLASPRGFCAGVERAITIVEKALERYGAPVYVRHEIVHNKHVVEKLRNQGAIFVAEIDDIPDGAVAIFNAHGVSKAVEERALNRPLSVLDATCPLVTKVHKEAIRHEEIGCEVILIGHKGHPEVEGTSGRIKGKMLIVSSQEEVETLEVKNPLQLAYVTQTTLSVDDTKAIIAALKRRFPAITGPELKDICYATQNRQNAVRELAQQVEIILVIGSKNSSNSNRLRDVGQEYKVPSYLINDASAIDPAWLENVTTIGITAGASAPEILVEEVLDYLATLRVLTVETVVTTVENVKFRLPKALEEAA